VSFDAYRRHAGGSISIAVTGTDNPVPTQASSATLTPPESAPAVPEPATDAKVPQEESKQPGPQSKKRRKKSR
jgi:hypothetical protein